MQYLGGKSKIRKPLSEFLESLRKPNQVYFEPFVGGGWVLQEMSGKRIASDGNIALIAMYQALQKGWVPPDFVSEETYKEAKNLELNDPMVAFCGFGCSFAGKWFGCYARSEGERCYAARSQRSLLKQLPLIQDVHFESKLFNEWKPKNALVYCDPPYANTTQYGAFNGFDHDLFWQTMRDWINRGNTVVVSEYEAPDDFVCVKEFVSQMGLDSTSKGNREKRTERVFMHKSQAHD
jgi:DNA adenine methylase